MSTERLTPDATYRGRLLTPAEYAASLDLLAEFARGPVQALRATTLSQDETAAWIALIQAGVIRAPAREGRAFQWDALTLTRYGKVYARQRGIAGEMTR